MHFRPLVLTTVFLVCYSIACATSATAKDLSANRELVCPKEVSFVEHIPAADGVLALLRVIYDEIGCATAFNPYPGRRSVLLFNSGKIDGQFARLRMIEENYTRKFLRSTAAVNRARAILWERKEIDPSRKTPLGYTIGVKWQDNYVRENQHVRGFESPIGKIEAFQNGSIDSFIETDQNIRLMIADGTLKTRPVQKEILLHFRAYHYLGSEFFVFMDRFNQAMEARRQANYLVTDIED